MPGSVLFRMTSPQAQLPAKPMTEKQRLKLEKLANKKERQAQQAQQREQAPNIREKKPKKQDVSVVDSKEWIEETPAGQRKILKPLDDDFHKAYVPKVVESAWYCFWEEQRLFQPSKKNDESPKTKDKYVIAIPPPNVKTGVDVDGMVAC